jgi:hypothetical protein
MFCSVSHSMSHRCSIFPFALILTLIALPMSAAAAPNPVCDKPELRAEGRRSNPGPAFFKERMARRNAMRKWQQLARELHGMPYATWRFASERNLACEHYKEPALNGRVSCVASARPCARGR